MMITFMEDQPCGPDCMFGKEQSSEHVLTQLSHMLRHVTLSMMLSGQEVYTQHRAEFGLAGEHKEVIDHLIVEMVRGAQAFISEADNPQVRILRKNQFEQAVLHAARAALVSVREQVIHHKEHVHG